MFAIVQVTPSGDMVHAMFPVGDANDVATSLVAPVVAPSVAAPDAACEAGADGLAVAPPPSEPPPSTTIAATTRPRTSTTSTARKILTPRLRFARAAICYLRGWGGCGRGPGGRARGRRSVEDGALGAGALELVEAGDAGDQHEAVPQPAGLLALRRRRHHRAEERGAVDRHDRGADLVADQRDGLGVRGAQLLVELVGVAVRPQGLRQADLVERLPDDRPGVLSAARVPAGAERVVQRLE